ncbi:MAG: 2-iminoacetate synthase ThiH [Peptoniphilaceae bacterium]|nr:2-iminoacetate synthase ThiH [Peptoniphilaceae bacterium]MDY6019694.1 2-iminoacetate synthase ThiH [Anaerococcus sp.]
MKTIYDYYPNMDKIKTDIPKQIKEKLNEVKKIKPTKSMILHALSKERLKAEDLYILLSDLSLDFLEDMANRARSERYKYFGNNVYLFSPLYIANYCDNSCKYCGFRKDSDILRAKLDCKEIQMEMDALSKTGIEDVLILTGEHEKNSSIEYIANACKLAKTYFREIGLEVYPCNVDDYKILHKAGADFVTVFQETYNEKAYDYFHPSGHKRNIEYRMNTQERAILGGMRGVGFGALFGLSDPIDDAFCLAYHAALVQKKYPYAEISISLPRIRPTHGADETIKLNLVSDKKLFQILLVMRIFMPFASITISTRESSDFRKLAVKYAATKISASVDTGIGHRSGAIKDTGSDQFEINDTNSTEDVYKILKDLGMTPVFTDYINI